MALAALVMAIGGPIPGACANAAPDSSAPAIPAYPHRIELSVIF
jgi:hypothetical protein